MKTGFALFALGLILLSGCIKTEVSKEIPVENITKMKDPEFYSLGVDLKYTVYVNGTVFGSPEHSVEKYLVDLKNKRYISYFEDTKDNMRFTYANNETTYLASYYNLSDNKNKNVSCEIVNKSTNYSINYGLYSMPTLIFFMLPELYLTKTGDNSELINLMEKIDEKTYSLTLNSTEISKYIYSEVPLGNYFNGTYEKYGSRYFGKDIILTSGKNKIFQSNYEYELRYGNITVINEQEFNEFLNKNIDAAEKNCVKVS